MKNLKNFKLSFTDNTTFTGVDAEGFYSKALLEGKTAQLFRLVPNVKSKIKMAQLDLGDILQQSDCTFSSDGEGILSQKTLEVDALKVNISLCQRTFEQNYLSELMRAGSNTDAILPETIEQWYLGNIAGKVQDTLEILTWQGDVDSSAPLNSTNGLEKKLGADANVNDVTIDAVNASNVIAEMTKVYDAIPNTILHKADLTIMVSSDVYRAYKQALASASAETNYMQSYNDLVFLGVPVVEAQGMSANKIVAGQRSNFVYLTDLLSDNEDVLVLPQKSVTGEPVVRFVAELKFGVDYLLSEEIVYGKTV